MAIDESKNSRLDRSIVTLRKRSAFLRLRSGKRISCKYFTLQTMSAPDEAGSVSRFGLTVTTKVGNAVVRNRIKRRLRSLVMEVLPDKGKHRHDYVLIARRDALRAEFPILVKEFSNALDRVHDNKAKAQLSQSA